MLTDIFEFFDIGLMISIILTTYAVFGILKTFKIKWKTWVKRLVTMAITTILSIFYFYKLGLTLDKVIPTYLISVVFYDYLIKVIKNKIKESSEPLTETEEEPLEETNEEEDKENTDGKE